MTFVSQITVGFFQAIGLLPSYYDIGSGATTRIYNLLTANVPVADALLNLVEAGSMTAAYGVTVIQLLYQQKLLWPVVKFILSQLGWYAYFLLVAQVLACFEGVGEVAALARFITWASQVTSQIWQYGDNCPAKSEAVTPALAGQPA
jgi:hypothetical protein